MQTAAQTILISFFLLLVTFSFSMVEVDIHCNVIQCRKPLSVESQVRWDTQILVNILILA